jgi:hypothetical protein
LEQAMGEGLTQVGLLAFLLLVVLPGCFFTLLALLDRMENSLAPESTRPATVAHAAVIDTSDVETLDVETLDVETLDVEPAGGSVIALPLTAAVSPEPAAATG